MSIGDKWDEHLGPMSKEASFKLLDAYADNGGNSIDTANNYQAETSEAFIGEWMKRNLWDQLVIATKYTVNLKQDQNPEAFTNKASYVGNNIKAMHVDVSVEASLKKLRTTYIDVLYVHWWDWETSIEEVMNRLNNLVVQGKVLYLGASDMPAWVVSEANRYARDHGKARFVIYQGMWNILERSFERDIIPMVRAHGMALAPWNVLYAGKLRTEAQEEQRRADGEKGRVFYHPAFQLDDIVKQVSAALEKIAGEVGAKSIQVVAIAYVMQKVPYCFPIIGGRKVEHFLANVEALDITLSKDQMEFLESIVPLNPGFPGGMIGDGTKHVSLMGSAGTFVKQPLLDPIRPTKD